MSKIIKASRITGEYRLDDYNYFKSKVESEQLRVKKGDKKDSDYQINENEKKFAEELNNDKYIKEAEKKAAEIIKEAEKTAEMIKEKADNAVEEARKEGFEKAYQDGLEKGSTAAYQEGLASFKEIISSFESIVMKTREELDLEIDNLYRDIIKLSVNISRKIISAELKIDPGLINDIIKNLLKELTDIEELNIFVNPDLLEYIEEDDLKSDFSKNRISFSPDPNLVVGDCIVETGFGCKDGSIEKQLVSLEKELLKGAGFYEED